MGNYVVGFYCAQFRLVIELDGSHHGEQKTCSEDAGRRHYLQREGFKVLRFWNNELDENIEGVLETIRREVNSLNLSPILSPRQGRGV